MYDISLNNDLKYDLSIPNLNIFFAEEFCDCPSRSNSSEEHLKTVARYFGWNVSLRNNYKDPFV